jgi:hypothetical protein
MKRAETKNIKKVVKLLLLQMPREVERAKVRKVGKKMIWISVMTRKKNSRLEEEILMQVGYICMY